MPRQSSLFTASDSSTVQASARTGRDYDAMVQAWERRAPLPSRLGIRLGMEGKLILCCAALVTAIMSVSCWMFQRQGEAQVTDAVADGGRQLVYALALASRPELEALPRDRRKADDLRRMARDLLGSRDMLFVLFLDADFKPVLVANRYADFDGRTIIDKSKDTIDPLITKSGKSRVFGDFLHVCAPVYGSQTAAGPGKLLGYVFVGMSLDRAAAELQQANLMIAGLASIMLLTAMPIVYLVIRHMFWPVRRLVAATQEIAKGQLNVRVDIDRPDVIGELARSFDEMTGKVRQQQTALADANGKLYTVNERLHVANTQLAGANSQLEAANRDLEQKVRDRTEEIQAVNGQLGAANGRLSKEVAEKEDFLRAVSHDLNAPLRNIAGMASMLLTKHREKFDADIVHRLERIQRNVQVETDLINELLELSRIKSRRGEAERVDTTAIVTELADMLDHDLKSRNISVVLDTPLPELNGERARLRQVFQNLIDNAIKYMGDGPVKEIHIGCVVRPQEAEFYVRDTGIGIDPEDIDKVFFIFRRGKCPAVQGVAGKGVGLASVKSIIETYSGSIWVESEVGMGSAFKFTINGQYVAPAAGELPTTTLPQAA